jgi:cell division protein FtsL
MTGESFDYAIKKDVRNNPIVREVDRERHREMWRSGTVGLFLVVVLVFSVWRHFQLLQHEYGVDELRGRIEAEERAGGHLRLEIEVLSSRARIEALATRLGMVEPGPDDQEVIERVVPSAPPPDTAVARR